jgi:hypothetical protein
MIQDEEKYKSLRNTLKSLPKVQAKGDFHSRLMHRISQAEKSPVHTKPVKPRTSGGWIANLFRPSFAPALGLTVVLLITVVVYFAYFSNTGKSPNNEVVTSNEKPGELVIYVKKETGESYSDNYPKEYSAVTTEDGTSEDRRMSPMETPSDYISKPDPTRTLDKDEGIKPDRVSEEQKLEMERSVDEKKGVDTKGERKGDDRIMKKESKGELKDIGSKTEGKESPYNVRDQKEGYINEGEEDSNIQQTQPAPENEADQKVKNKNEDSEIFYQNQAPRLGRVTNDSTKAKSKSEADQKEDSTDQK